MEKDQILRSADEARYILTHELFKAAFEDTRNDLIAILENGLYPVHDNVERDKIVLSIHVLRKVKAHIEQHITNGQVAAYDPLEDENEG